MPLYASDGENYIYAADAEPRGSYRCLECKAPLKVRRGKNRIAHFYHLQTSPSCRLYSKSEDHLLIQLQIQKLLPSGEAQIEVPFLIIHRIADLLWESQKIIFEIQCSSIHTKEAENRIRDYRKLGYEIIWLFDDRLFNRKMVRPAEDFLRTHSCYFFRFQRNNISFFYDQFEIILNGKRVETSRKLQIDLKKIYSTPKIEDVSFIPNQIIRRAQNSPQYFKGDLISWAFQAEPSPFIMQVLNDWKKLELEWAKEKREPIQMILQKKMVRPYLKWIEDAAEGLS